MSKERSLLICDDEFKDAADYIRDYCEAIVDLIDDYTKCVEAINSYAIQDQLISQKLENLIIKANQLKQPIKVVGKECRGNIKRYILEIDKADQFLY